MGNAPVLFHMEYRIAGGDQVRLADDQDCARANMRHTLRRLLNQSDGSWLVSNAIADDMARIAIERLQENFIIVKKEDLG